MSSPKQLCPNNIDRISELPDSVLIHILSFLPTIYAVRTSRLAQRWRYLWKSIYHLDFDKNAILDAFFPRRNVHEYCTLLNKKGENMIRETEKLMHGKVIKFVDGVLLLLARLNIETFSLSCLQYAGYLSDYYLSAIDRWVLAVVARNVQEIRLSLSFPRAVHLPPCLFTCDSLRTLHLDMDGGSFELPSTIQFAKLKTMHLTSVTFSDENLPRRLFSCSPVLESLYILDCRTTDTLATFDIISDSLKKLVLGCRSTTSVLFLSAPKIDWFIFQGFMLGSPHTSLPSITKSDIMFSREYEPDVNAMEIFNSVHMSRYMKMCDLCVKVLGKNFEANASSPFRYLKQLEIAVTSSKQSWEVVIHLIETNLELNKLIINLTYPPSDDKKTDAVGYKCLASSQQKNLTSISMMNVVGRSEVSFLKYLLKTQSGLKEMTVKFHSKGWGRHERVSKELFRTPRLSTGLALVVI